MTATVPYVAMPYHLQAIENALLWSGYVVATVRSDLWQEAITSNHYDFSISRKAKQNRPQRKCSTFMSVKSARR